MSLANLKRMKKELLLINKKNNINKLIIKSLDGLFLIDLSKIDKGRVAPVEEVPEGMNVETIGANMEDILVCGGLGDKPVFIINDIPDDNIDVSDDIDIINIVPAFKDI